MMVWQGFSHMKDFLATNQGHQNKKKKKKNYIKLLSTAISKGVFVFFFFFTLCFCLYNDLANQLAHLNVLNRPCLLSQKVKRKSVSMLLYP